MDFKILEISVRSVTLEMLNKLAYYTDKPYDVYINGELRLEKQNKNIVSLYNLQPNETYEVTVKTIDSEFTENFTTLKETVRLNVKRFGAVGDGVKEDTGALQAAILACPDQGTVYLPKGIYLSAPLFLKSNITIEFAEGATLLGIIERDKYPILPGYTSTTDEKDEYYLGTWEGNPLGAMASLITGINVENVKIIGQGTIDGNGHQGDWWIDVRNKRRAWRPRTVFLNNCKHIVFQGIKVQNSPSWTMHPYFSEHVKFIDMTITNPYNSHNTDGIDPESCKDVAIVGVNISVGDDCIAIKSGKLFMGKKFKKPSEDLQIRNCIMEKGHGAVVIGSEISGGVRNVHVSQCLFKQTDRGLRIKTRRGRGEDSILDQIHFSNIIMDEVMTPFVINMYYYCDPDGKTQYVWSKEKLPVDEMTPSIRSLSFREITCHNSEVAAAFFYGLPEMPIEEVVLDGVYVDFKEDAQKGVPAMMSHIEPISKQGIFARHIKSLTLKNVTIKGNEGLVEDIDLVDKVIRN